MASEPGRDGIGFDHGTRIWHGVGGVYSAGEGRIHGMREDGVGVGDVGEVFCGARGRRNMSGGDDGWCAGKEHKPGVVGRLGRTE